MKIFIVMAGFFPGKRYGGPPVSILNCINLLSEDFYILTRNHDLDYAVPYKGIEEDTWIKKEKYYIKYVSDNKYKKAYFEKNILEVEPDIIYLQGLFQECILPCLIIARKHGIPVLLAPRGELCDGAFKKKYKKYPYIFMLKCMELFKNVSFQSTSEEETDAIIRYLKVDDRIHYLPNVPSIPAEDYQRKTKERGKGKFVFLSRIHPKKNLLGALACIKEIKQSITFDIFGPIEDEHYWHECVKLIEKMPDNITVNYCGMVSHEHVHEVLSRYDGFILLTYGENYGHVIAEALAVGTPVIISDRTPWRGLNGTCGIDADIDDHSAVQEELIKIINMDQVDFAKYANNVKKFFDNKVNINLLREKYRNMFLASIKNE